jgi:hypothetical protein
MPRHWWIPVHPSDPKERKKVVDKAAKKRKRRLHSFWKNQDGSQLYALVTADELEQEFLEEIGANGDPIELGDEGDLVRV